MPRCLQMLCHGEQQGVGATDADYSVSNAVSPRATRRKCSASVSAATWAFAAYETLSSRCALRHHDRIQANAVSQRAARVLMLRSLNHRLRDAVSMGGRRRMVAHLFQGQMGCMKLRRHKAAALRCGIMLGCRPLLCHRELRGCWCRGR